MRHWQRRDSCQARCCRGPVQLCLSPNIFVLLFLVSDDAGKPGRNGQRGPTPRRVLSNAGTLLNRHEMANTTGGRWRDRGVPECGDRSWTASQTFYTNKETKTSPRSQDIHLKELGDKLSPRLIIGLSGPKRSGRWMVHVLVPEPSRPPLGIRENLR